MSKIKIVPCSGIGKVFGLMAREAALNVTDKLAPDTTETACLAHLVTGDDTARAKVSGCACITVDGCPAMCAAKSVAAAGGDVKAKFRAVDEMRNHRGEQAGTGSVLTEAGWKITDELAAKIAATAEKLKRGEKEDA